MAVMPLGVSMPLNLETPALRKSHHAAEPTKTPDTTYSASRDNLSTPNAERMAEKLKIVMGLVMVRKKGLKQRTEGRRLHTCKF